jgi:hypothetical protein
MNNTDWNNPLPSVVPQAVPGLLGEREDHPRSMRWPKDVAAAIEELAKEYGQEFSTTALHLMKNAVAEVKAARGKKRSSLKRSA